MSRRSEELRRVARDFVESHKAWQADGNRPNPDASYWDAVDEVLTAFDGGDIPADCRELHIRVGKLQEQVEQFDDLQDQGESVLMPRKTFFTAVEGVELALQASEPRQLPPLESIAELAALPNMSHDQIARMYGFIDRRGEPMRELVKRELDKPGSVLTTPGAVDGRDWKDPRIAEVEAQEAPAVRRKAQEIGKRRRAEEDEKPCPETAEQLWETSTYNGGTLTVEQAAKMLKLKVPAVAAMFKTFADEAATLKELEAASA